METGRQLNFRLGYSVIGLFPACISTAPSTACLPQAGAQRDTSEF